MLTKHNQGEFYHENKIQVCIVLNFHYFIFLFQTRVSTFKFIYRIALINFNSSRFMIHSSSLSLSSQMSDGSISYKSHKPSTKNLYFFFIFFCACAKFHLFPFFILLVGSPINPFAFFSTSVSHLQIIFFDHPIALSSASFEGYI